MSEAKNEIRLNALVMRSFVNMLPKYDDIFWSETPDDLKCDVDFAKEHLAPYVDEFARLQEIEKHVDSVTSQWSARCQELEEAITLAIEMHHGEAGDASEIQRFLRQYVNA